MMSGPTAYFDENGKPCLRQSYCVFADFLGFRQKIRDSVKKGEEQNVFLQFMKEVEPEIEFSINPSFQDDIEGVPRMWDAKVFTDNVVLGYALWSGHGQKEFGHVLSQITDFQFSVALKGYFVRGGWSIGNLFINRNTVFGAALLDAYDLECKEAIYPRVILSNDMKEMVFQQMARWSENPPHCSSLVVDESGMLFTNYLLEAVTGGAVRWSDLQVHAQLIRDRLIEFASEEKVFSKYSWLAGYHNKFCDWVSSFSGFDDGVKIEDVPELNIRQLEHDDSPYTAEMKALRIQKRNLRPGRCDK